MKIFIRDTAALAAVALVSMTARADTTELEEVVVTSARIEQPLSQVIGSATVITREDIERRQAQSIQDLLRGEAGIDIANQGGLGKLSSIFMRGANANQTLILVDGVRLGSATAGTTAIEFLPVEQIERIEIVRGPRSGVYGSDAIGGVIQIFTRRSNGVSAKVTAGTHQTQNYSASLGLNSEALRFNLSGSYLQSDGFDACRGPGGCFTIEPDDDGFRSTAGSARVGYAFGEIADLEVSTLYSQGYTEYDGFFNQGRFRQSAPTAKLRVTPGDAFAITLLGGVTADKLDNFDNNAQLLSRYETKKHSASLQADWSLSDAHRVSFGVDYLRDEIDTIVDPFDLTTAYAATARDSHGEFLQYLGTFGAHEIGAAVRNDDSSQYGSHTTGNLGWKWFVLDRAFAINASAGKAFHAPTFNDLYFPYGSGNPDLKPERSKNVEVGVSGEAAWLKWSLQAYSADVDDLIALDSFFFPINTDARLRGAELTLSGRWDSLDMGLNLTSQDPRSRETGSNYDHLLPRRARQSGRLNIGYEIGIVRVSGILNVVGKRYDTLTNTARLAGYSTLDLLGDVKLGKAWTLQAKLTNAFDREYETVQFYNQDGRAVYVTVRYAGWGK